MDSRNNSTSAVILAGGLGSRLGALTSDLPKPLIQVHGQPLIAFVAGQLSDVGISDLVITLGYLGEKVEAWTKGSIRTVWDGGTTMSESFLKASQTCAHESILGFSCDTLVPRSALLELCSFHAASDAGASLLLTKNSGQSQKKWSYEISSEETLVTIEARPDTSPVERLGVAFSKSALSELTDNFTSGFGSVDDDFEGLEHLQRGWNFLLGRLMQRGIRVQARVTNIPVYNVNTPEALDHATDFLSANKAEFARFNESNPC